MSRIPLKDVTFLLIVKFDTVERIENTVHIANYLYNHFNTNIILWEFGRWNNGIMQRMLPDGVLYQFHEDVDPVFHRTHFLNNMIESVKTEFVAVWDVDVIIRKEQIIDSVCRLKNGVDVVYPYEKFYDTTDDIRNLYLSSGGDVSVLLKCTKYMNELYGSFPVGGAFFIRTKLYFESGMENENYYGWGYEDGDRYYKWVNLGYKIGRVSSLTFPI